MPSGEGRSEETADLSSSDSIRVVIRVRPKKSSEVNTEDLACSGRNRISLKTAAGRPQRHYDFDFVADGVCAQELVFEQAGRPVVDCTLAGFHGTIFAYGQTGSGKTHTMTGPVGAKRTDPIDNRGVVPRACEAIFDHVSKSQSSDVKFSIRASYLEIYNEKIRDLLVDPKHPPKETLKNGKGIYIRETASGEVIVEGGRTWVDVFREEDCVKVLSSGAAHRSVGATAMNSESSRSHAIFTIEMTRTSMSSMKERISQLHMVDLAGSERQKSTQAQGERLKEANEINKSLTSLGNVIQALVDAAQKKSARRHIPYRDSKLTFLLKDALGGNSKTCLVATVSPAEASISETASTLDFAKRCSAIKTTATINEMLTSNVTELQAEVRRLRGLVKKLESRNTNMFSRLNSSGNLGENENHDTRREGDVTKISDSNPDGQLAIEAEAKRADEAVKLAEEESIRASKESQRAEDEHKRAEAEASRAERLQQIVTDSLAREEKTKEELRVADGRISEFVQLVERQDKTTQALRAVIELKDDSLKDLRSGDWNKDRGVKRLRREIELIKVQRDNHPEIARLSMELCQSEENLRSLSASSPTRKKKEDRNLEDQMGVLTKELENALAENGALRELTTPRAGKDSPFAFGLGQKCDVCSLNGIDVAPSPFERPKARSPVNRQDSALRANKLNDLLASLRDSVHNLEDSISTVTAYTPRSVQSGATRYINGDTE